MAEITTGEDAPKDVDKEFDVALLDKFEKDPASVTPEEAKKIVDNSKAQHNLAKHWRDNAVDSSSGKKFKELYAEKNAVVKDNIPPQTPAAIEALKKDVDGLKTSEEKRSFGHQHKLSPEATDNVFSYAQGRGLKPEDALKDDFVKSGLAALQARERLAGSVPGPSRRMATVGGKSFTEMKPEERRANFAKLTGAEG